MFCSSHTVRLVWRFGDTPQAAQCFPELLGAWQVLAGPGLVCSWESELLLRKGQVLHRHGLCFGLSLGTATEITKLS